jgi:hypothetical protein
MEPMMPPEEAKILEYLALDLIAKASIIPFCSSSVCKEQDHFKRTNSTPPSTTSPETKGKKSTTPAWGAQMVCSIFMASKIRRG